MGKLTRVVVCGAKAAGKTAVLQQLAFAADITNEPYSATIDDTYTIQADLEKGAKETVLFHDTAGLDGANPELRKCYIAVADAFLLVYSIDSADSFNRMDLTKTFLDKTMKERKEPAVPLVVLASKSDLADRNGGRAVEKDFALNWAQREKVKLFEVTAKDRRTLIEPIEYLCSKLFVAPKEAKFGLTKRIRDKQTGAAIVMDI